MKKSLLELKLCWRNFKNKIKMEMVGIIELPNVESSTKTYSKVFNNCVKKDFSKLQTFGTMSSSNVCFTFVIENVFAVDTLLSNVRRLTKNPLAFRVLIDGKDVDMSMLK